MHCVTQALKNADHQFVSYVSWLQDTPVGSFETQISLPPITYLLCKLTLNQLLHNHVLCQLSFAGHQVVHYAEWVQDTSEESVGETTK